MSEKQNMDVEIFNLYEMSSEKESKFWDDCIFIFDSSALLDFYYIPKESRSVIYSDVFAKLNHRLWIPFQVQYEYLKNRKKINKKTISEKYKPLEEKLTSLLKTVDNELSTKAIEIKNDTKKDNKHPYLDQKEIDEFIKKIDSFKEHANSFKKGIEEKIEVKKKEILAVEENDDILESLNEYFHVGEEFSFEEILSITKEGKHRFEFDIPPGYSDSKGGNRKKGTQIFGDLIIWKEILKYSKKVKKPVILITNDVSKDEDWCYSDKGNIKAPREELIKEIKDYSGVLFWMYSLSQYLYKANKYMKSDINKEVIKSISEQVTTKKRISSREILNVIARFNFIKSTKLKSLISCELELFIKDKYIDREIIQPQFKINNAEINTANMILIVEENILIEVNLSDSVSSVEDYFLSILISYNIKEGIQYFPNIKNNNIFEFGSITKNINQEYFHIYQIFGG